ncbi:hypothetical protein L6R49_31405 [Myxococcota bacterium]|nr:hypothetical protein [Myxococcota bacterium]
MRPNPLHALLSALGLSSGVKLRGKRARGSVGASHDPDRRLSVELGPDGSAEGDVARTSAALACLLLLHTPLQDPRVLRARAWLREHQQDALASLALGLYDRAEAGLTLTPDASWLPLGVRGPEGRLLHQLMSGARPDTPG